MRVFPRYPGGRKFETFPTFRVTFRYQRGEDVKVTGLRFARARVNFAPSYIRATIPVYIRTYIHLPENISLALFPLLTKSRRAPATRGTSFFLIASRRSIRMTFARLSRSVTQSSSRRKCLRAIAMTINERLTATCHGKPRDDSRA